MWEEEWFMVSPHSPVSTQCPGLGLFYFIVHLVLFNPLLLPNLSRKGGGNNTQRQKHQHKKKKREALLQHDGNCQRSNWWLQITDAKNQEKIIWKGRRKEKTNLLPSPSGKSIKEKNRNNYWSVSRKWMDLGQVEMRVINVVGKKEWRCEGKIRNEMSSADQYMPLKYIPVSSSYSQSEVKEDRGLYINTCIWRCLEHKVIAGKHGSVTQIIIVCMPGSLGYWYCQKLGFGCLHQWLIVLITDIWACKSPLNTQVCWWGLSNCLTAIKQFSLTEKNLLN